MSDVEKLIERGRTADIQGNSLREVQDNADALCRELADALAALQAENERLRAEADAMKKAAQDYCWMRYKDREPLHLNSPAVFTSHEWQKIGEAMDRARAALKGDAP